MRALNIGRMPSNSECRTVTKNLALSNQISKKGGFGHWAKKLKLQMKDSDSKTGWGFENSAEKLLSSFGFTVEHMPVRHPYDLLINNSVKIDVKGSFLYNGKSGSFYTFNLQKKHPTCDIFMLFCVGKFEEEKTLIVPAQYCHKTQISVGEISSKWDEFSGKWAYIERLVTFNKSLLEERRHEPLD